MFKVPPYEDSGDYDGSRQRIVKSGLKLQVQPSRRSRRAVGDLEQRHITRTGEAAGP